MSAGNARRFAPIPRAGTSHETKQDDGPELRGVIFDMDGTLCEPQNYMFGQMRAALEIDKGTDILDHIYSLPEPQQSQAMDKVRTIEREAMSQQKPQPGLNELMTFLDSKAVLKGICTRNFEYVSSTLV
jgi:phosphoglycolate phosphatase-like HAD superfamily hydrolase